MTEERQEPTLKLVSSLRRFLSYRESKKMIKEQQGPTISVHFLGGVCLIEGVNR